MDGRRLSAQDALWLTMDRPTNLMVIDVAIVLDGTISVDVLRRAFSRMIERHPVFAQRAERRGTGWVWVDDPRFDLDAHIVEEDLPTGATMAGVQAVVGRERSRPLDRDRPLWCAHLMSGVTLDDGSTGSVVLARFHHAIADGVRLTQVMLAVLDPDYASMVPPVARAGTTGGSVLSWDAARASTQEVARLTATGVKGVVSAITRVFTDPRAVVTDSTGGLLSGLGALRHPDRFVDVLQSWGADDHRTVNDATATSKLIVGGSPRTVWTGRPGTCKAVAWSTAHPLGPIKAAARRHDATLNDVLIGALAGALRTYLEGRGDAVDEVVWMVPVNLTPFDQELPRDLGNHFALVMLDLPLTGADTTQRIADVRERTQRIKNSDEPVLTFGMQRAISWSPSVLATALTDFFANKAVGILTNVPGPTEPLHLEGVQVRQVVGFAPCSGDQPLTATIFTYAGGVTVGFASDTDLVPDPETLVRLVEDELREMAAHVD